MKIAFLFPGQGSQHPGMGRDLADNSPAARAVFEAVDEALDTPLSRLCYEGPEEELRLTTNTQPALLAVSAAAWAALVEMGPPPDPACLAGHSLGEWSAHVAAGTLDVGEAALAVRRRGRYMQEAVPVGEGAMAAVIGLERKDLEEVCEAAGGQVWISVDNGPGQTVIAGVKGDVERAGELAGEAGARRVVFLEVSAPFHTPLMRPARERLAADLDELALRDPRWPVLANVDAAPRTTAREARDALVRQVTEPVRWTEILERLRDDGVDTLVEVGAGRVLAGLARKVSREWSVLGVQDTEGVREALAHLQGGD